MPQFAQPTQPLQTRLSASSNAHEIKMMQVINRSNPTICLHVNTIFSGKREEAVNDGMTVLCGREHTFVCLSHQRYAVTLKPMIRIRLAEPLHQTLHQSMTTRIYLLQISDRGERIGAVAPSAPRNLDLSQHLPSFFEDAHIQLRAKLLQVNGQEEPSRTTSDYRYALSDCFHSCKFKYNIRDYKPVEIKTETNCPEKLEIKADIRPILSFYVL